MTSAVSVGKVKDEQEVLQKAYDKSRLVWDKANLDLKSKKSKLCKFRDKYGRVIAMMEEDNR